MVLVEEPIKSLAPRWPCQVDCQVTLLHVYIDLGAFLFVTRRRLDIGIQPFSGSRRSEEHLPHK